MGGAVVARSIRVGLINTGLPAGSPAIRAIARSLLLGPSLLCPDRRW